MNEVTLRYSESLLREAVRAFVVWAILRGLGWRFFIVCAALTGCIGYLLVQGDRSWVVGVLASTLGFVGVHVLVVYRSHYRNTMGRFRQMQRPEATLTYTEE